MFLVNRPIPEKKEIRIYYKSSENPSDFDFRLFELLKEYCLLFFIPSIELNELIHRNYFTKEEEAYESEKKARIIAQWITIAVAVLSIGISTIFNIINNTNERVVTIKNQGAFKDTVQVSITNTKIDSLKK